MIVCSCNRFTHKEVRETLAAPLPPTCVKDVYASLGCAPVCGGCAGMIERIMRAESEARRLDSLAVEPVERDAA